MTTLHSDAATAPKQPMGSVFAPLVRRKSRTSKLVRCPAFAFSLPRDKEQSGYSGLGNRRARTALFDDADSAWKLFGTY
jgi:hypothetical protein